MRTTSSIMRNTSFRVEFDISWVSSIEVNILTSKVRLILTVCNNWEILHQHDTIERNLFIRGNVVDKTNLQTAKIEMNYCIAFFLIKNPHSAKHKLSI